MKALFYLLLLFTCLSAKAQQEIKLHEIAVALDSFRSRVPVEKVHLHLDKPFYSLGDTIWMKAYLVNENKELSALSKLLYVDLVNDKDSIKTGLRLPLTGGLAWGALTL